MQLTTKGNTQPIKQSKSRSKANRSKASSCCYHVVKLVTIYLLHRYTFNGYYNDLIWITANFKQYSAYFKEIYAKK